MVSLSLAAMLLVPAAGRAATVDASAGLTFTAAAGEANQLVVTAKDGGPVTFVDSGVTLIAGTGCQSPSAHTVTCPVALGSAPSLHIDLGDGDDSADLSGVVTSACLPLTLTAALGDDRVAGPDSESCTAAQVQVSGGSGHDALATGHAPATLNGDGGDDVLTGSGGADVLNGGADDDILDGHAGPDVMDGGDGQDGVDYSARKEPVFVDLAATDPVDGGKDEGDRAVQVEEARGGAADDVLRGNGSANVLSGGDGADRLDGRAGADQLVGGAGRDTADYGSRTENLRVVIGGGAISGGALDGPNGARDRIDSSVENLVGGSGGDALTGDAGDNVLDGGPGADVLNGGGGEDAADYSSRTAALTLADDGRPNSGDDTDGPAGQRDAIAQNLEDLWGGSGDDVLVGNAGSNLLDGGAGADVLTGGGGEDAADYSERSAGVTAALDGLPNSGNEDDGPEGARDTLRFDVEDLFGGSGADELHGGPGRNYVAGEGGDDLLDVRDRGADYADCGDGNDTGWVAPDDVAASNCDRIGAGPDVGGGPEAADATPAQVRISLLGARQTPATVLATGLQVHYTCSETCTLDARLYLPKSAARDLHLKRLPKSRLIGRTPVHRDGKGQGTFTLTIVPRVAAAVKRSKRLNALVSVLARDGAGNKTRVARRLVIGQGEVRLADGAAFVLHRRR